MSLLSFLPPFIILLRLGFLFGAYKLRRRTNDSFHFCLANLGSSALWAAYGLSTGEYGLVYRNGTEVIFLVVFAGYLVYSQRKMSLPRFAVVRQRID